MPNNKKRLRELITSMDLKQHDVVNLIREETGRPVTTRTIRKWLANDDVKSSVDCPDWIIQLLEKNQGFNGREEEGENRN